MKYTFRYAAVFNQNINGWATGAVKTMSNMFYGAKAFNQNLNNWDTSAVKYMDRMFQNAAAFNQTIYGWDTTIATKPSMFDGNTLMTETQKPHYVA